MNIYTVIHEITYQLYGTEAISLKEIYCEHLRFTKEDCMSTYKIIRFFFSHDNEEIESGLTLEEAQDHCHDPETSSSTCTEAEGLIRTAKYGPWFDGYTEE